jgi:glycosyltransferase involved in cell wall biosynthesis
MKTIKTKPVIAQVVAYYPPHIGGMERVALTISEELAKNGYPVRVITSDNGIDKNIKRQQSHNLSVDFLKSFEIAHTPVAPMLFWHLLKLPKRSIIHLHLSQAYFPEIVMLISALRGIPYVVHFHLDVGPSGKFGWLLPLYKKFFLGTVLRRAKKIIVFSEEQSLLIRDKYNLKNEQIVIIPNGVADKFFYEKEMPVQRSLMRILYVGRLSPQKRIDRMIEAVSFLDFPAQIIIVGDGQDRKMLEQIVKKLALNNITFLGKKFGDELISCYRQADVFLIPSEKEGMPLSVLEAMASGLPIVGSDVIGIRELIKDVGILVEDPSPETFAKALKKIWEEPKLFQKLSLQSKMKAEQYSWKKLVMLLEDVYNKLKV